MASGRPRIILADSRPIILEGLRRVLETDYHIVATVRSGPEVLATVAERSPAAVLLDVLMPDLGGLEVARRLIHRPNPIAILFFSVVADPEYVEEARRIGAGGYLSKTCEPEELVSALHTVLGGGSYYPPTSEPSRPLRHGLEREGVIPLTPRQIEVLRLVAEGRSGKEIAHILCISTKTVEFHKAAICNELGRHSTAELVRYALAHGLLSEETQLK